MDGPDHPTVQWILSIYQEYHNLEQHYRSLVEARTNQNTILRQKREELEKSLRDVIVIHDCQAELITTQQEYIASLMETCANQDHDVLQAHFSDNMSVSRIN